ncbi:MULTISPECIES: sulfite exporter TauE/SafE family protein [unclassified Polaribacter]|uniref:sulfite exporter TauE/SafE family protein n=1 Tax=unclassified Polaribacter TaxID=196858 RepID=UPI002938F51D|nr:MULTISPECIES: sulfite exporter TauE/SafE family protein [unclassified Polaribacter]
MILLVVGLGIFAGFFIQTLSGFAGALIALPILLLVLGLQDAIAYISIFYFFSSVYLIAQEWKHIDRKIILKLTLATILGVGLGTWVLAHGKPMFLKKGLGVFILAYVMYSVYAKDKVFKQPKLEFLFGLAGGFFSGLFSTGGPLYVIVVKNSAVTMKSFRATMFGILGLITAIRIPSLYTAGILNMNQVYYSLYIMPFFIVAIYLGKKAYAKLNEVVLKRGVLALLFLSGMMLLLK